MKDGIILSTIDLSNKPYYVFGRNQNTSDVYLENPSISRAHLVLQHKDTGDVFLYDLESTHGTFINKKLIPSRKYIKLAVGDVFKLGQSTKLFILNGPQSDASEDASAIQSFKTMLSKEELYQRRVEQIKKQAEEHEKNKIIYKHNEDGIDWGMGEDQEEDPESDSEDISNIDIEQIKKRNDLNENQKKIVKQINDLNKKIGSLLDKNKAEHTTENDVEIFQLREDVYT